MEKTPGETPSAALGDTIYISFHDDLFDVRAPMQKRPFCMFRYFLNDAISVFQTFCTFRL